MAVDWPLQAQRPVVEVSCVTDLPVLMILTTDAGLGHGPEGRGRSCFVVAPRSWETLRRTASRALRRARPYLTLPAVMPSTMCRLNTT